MYASVCERGGWADVGADGWKAKQTSRCASAAQKSRKKEEALLLKIARRRRRVEASVLAHVCHTPGMHRLTWQSSLFRGAAEYRQTPSHPATRNRTRDHLIPASVYSQMLYQLSYSRLNDAVRLYTCCKKNRSGIAASLPLLDMRPMPCKEVRGCSVLIVARTSPLAM